VPANEPGIVYTPRPDATSETEISALAVVYRFVLFESNASKKTTEPEGSDDHRRRVNEQRRPP
jgi:hypothetical protein